MELRYGKEKGDQIYYASENKGTITGTHKRGYGGGGGSPVKFMKREGGIK